MKRFLLSLVLLVAMALTLAACGGAAAPPAAEEPAAAVEEPAEEVAEEPAEEVAEEPAEEPAADPAAEPTAVVGAFGTCDDPLILWHGLTGTDGAVFAVMLENFATANPDICVTSEGYAWDVFFQKYPTAVAAGSPPDMVIFHAGEVAQMASEGLMAPMDALIFDDGTLSKDAFSPGVMEAVTYNGETMAVPFDNHGWMLWYNAKLLEDAGFDSDTLPANGAEFIEWAQQLTTDVNGLHPTDEGFDPDNVDVWAMSYTWPRFTIPSTLWQFGASVVSEDGETATLDSPEAIAAIQYWHDLMYKYYVAPPAIPGQIWGGELYTNNRLVFMWEGTWTGGLMNDNPDVAALTKVGSLNSLAPDGNQAVKFDAHIMSVPTGVDSDGAEKAKALMAYLAENGEFWATSGQVPAMLEVQALPSVQGIESVAAAAAQFNAIGRTDTASPAFIEIQTAWETAVGNALASPDADIAGSLAAGNAQIQAILDRP